MESAFALFPPEGLVFEKPKDTNKFQKYAEFALYNLPQMLEKHSSSRLCDNYLKIARSRKHKRSNSIVIDTSGILMGACKNVSFSPNVETKTYKKDAW